MPSAIALSVLAAAALYLTVIRGRVCAEPRAIGRAQAVAAIATIVQSAHFIEEAGSGFNDRFPALAGLPPMPMSVFIAINVVAIAVWGFAVWALRHRPTFTLFPLWFLAVGSLANALFHPAFALADRAYFPGLVSAPVCGLMGWLLFRRLQAVTQSN